MKHSVSSQNQCLGPHCVCYTGLHLSSSVGSSLCKDCRGLAVDWQIAAHTITLYLPSLSSVLYCFTAVKKKKKSPCKASFVCLSCVKCPFWKYFSCFCKGVALLSAFPWNSVLSCFLSVNSYNSFCSCP